METKEQTQELDWNDNTLEVNDDGHVEGQAWFGPFAGGYDVSISVMSYDFEQYGETKTNHVPHIVVTTVDGSIVDEPHTHDSRNPERAIKNAKNAAQYVAENPEQFDFC